MYLKAPEESLQLLSKGEIPKGEDARQKLLMGKWGGGKGKGRERKGLRRSEVKHTCDG